MDCARASVRYLISPKKLIPERCSGVPDAPADCQRGRPVSDAPSEKQVSALTATERRETQPFGADLKGEVQRGATFRAEIDIIYQTVKLSA